MKINEPLWNWSIAFQEIRDMPFYFNVSWLYSKNREQARHIRWLPCATCRHCKLTIDIPHTCKATHTTRNVAFSRAKISFFKRGENIVPRKARKKRRQKVEDSFITKLYIMKCNFHDIFSALLVYYGSRHFVLFSLSRQKNWSRFLENALHRLIAVVLLRMNVAPIAKAIIHRNVDD